MRPTDPRLLRHASRAAIPIGALAGLGLCTAGAVIAQAWVLAAVIAGVVAGRVTVTTGAIAVIAAIAVARGVAAWAAHAVAHLAAIAAKGQLRGALLARVIALGPGRRPGDTATLTQLATTGLDGLDGYFTSYLPALVLAIAVPLATLAAIAAADPLSAIAVGVTVPLVPLFGALIGMTAGRRAQARLTALATLAHHFHDVVRGLATLRVFGRAAAQRARIERVTQEYRRATMGTLRLAFASGLALELIATMSVALVATEIGLRLAYGHLDLRTGLFVLILAPEAYLPLRALGTQFHAAADGLAAAGEVFAILDAPLPAPAPARAALAMPSTSAAPAAPVAPVAPVAPAPVSAAGVPAAGCLIEVTGVSVRHADRATPAPDGATFTITGGRLTVITGPSGCGKTTLLSCLLGFTEPAEGSITSRGSPLPAPGWLPQHPVLFSGTVAANIRLGWPDAPREAVAAAASAAALDDVPLGRLPGERGGGLSAGQRRRVALARALLPNAPVLLLDEPTAGVDPGREAIIVAALRERAATGTAVVAVTHRPALIAAADEIVDLAAPRDPADPAAPATPAAPGSVPGGVPA